MVVKMVSLDAYKDPRDPYRDLLRSVDHPCSHGHGDDCECQLPVYEGLFVAPMTFGRDKIERHVVVRMQLTHDGGMVQFRDPVNKDVVVGSCGIYFMWREVQRLRDFMEQYV